MNKFTKTRKIIMLTLFVFGIMLVLIGHRLIGYIGLGLEFLGLIMLLLCLFLYNEAYC